MEQVSLRNDAYELTLLVHHEQTPKVVVTHQFQGILKGRVPADGNRRGTHAITYKHRNAFLPS
jgi:hypothetical protein